MLAVRAISLWVLLICCLPKGFEQSVGRIQILANKDAVRLLSCQTIRARCEKIFFCASKKYINRVAGHILLIGGSFQVLAGKTKKRSRKGSAISRHNRPWKSHQGKKNPNTTGNAISVIILPGLGSLSSIFPKLYMGNFTPFFIQKSSHTHLVQLLSVRHRCL
jgi:hypothetical protein